MMAKPAQVDWYHACCAKESRAVYSSSLYCYFVHLVVLENDTVN